jgi:hypothetical protein
MSKTNKRVAVFYTGDVRTMERTIPYFKHNMLLTPNLDVDVFAVLQTLDKPHFEKILKGFMENHLKYVHWLDKNDKIWTTIKENLISKIKNVDNEWKDYLKTSGSMIEYFQMYLAYLAMEEKENREGFKYDYVMRIRCDVVLTYPILFDWYNYTIDDVKNHIEYIKENKKIDDNNIISPRIISFFMNTIYHKDRVLCNEIIYDNNLYSQDYKEILDVTNKDDFIIKLHNYLINGKYITTLRSNILYFTKRKFFTDIHNLGMTYGNYKMKNNDYWFNAESQFKQICIDNDFDIFDSTTYKEGKSLYEYNESKYFINGNLIRNHECLFFIRRY